MLIWENIKLALAGILGNKMRSILTMLGIIIGIGSVIAIMTVSTSLTSSITSAFANLGANNITVGVRQLSEQQETRSNGMRFGKSNRQVSLDEEDRITDDMIEQLKNTYSDEIDSIALSESVGSATVTSGENSASIDVTGINRGYYDANDVSLIAGRYITDDDVSKEKAVIMVSDKMVSSVFGEDAGYTSVLGKRILVSINNLYYSFYIVGVYEYEEDSTNFSSESDEEVSTSAYVPITTGKAKLHSDEGYSQFTVVTNETISDVTTFATQIKNYMNNEFYKNNEDYQIQTTTMSTITESMSETISTVSIAIAFIAGISLLVGGIGVMNIMLVSITERTREIGTRKALGAKNSSIRLQFIIEAMILCLIGGLLGILLGFGLGAIAASVMGYSASAPVVPIIGSVVFSMVIGMFFGFYPANKAAKMDPIEALRYE
ncbi:MAG TPA: ABC transporter [Lachnospiraceae bacterium]|nr:ABC transporter [Lachnospiraceae bacterium]